MRTNPSDSQVERLRRQLSAEPADVELQHALMGATVRAGELPEEALRRLVPGRPVQPWQWSPVSYVLLEAERIGRESGWQEGRVEIEWVDPEEFSPSEAPDVYGTSDMLPARGGPPALFQSGEDNYFTPARYTHAYVGARTVDWEKIHLVAGKRISEHREHGPYGSESHTRYALSVVPARWIPSLDHVAAFEVRQAREGGLPYLGYADLSDTGSIKRPQDYEYFGGCCPDAYDPQVLLYASRQIVSRGRSRLPGRGRTRRLVQEGPLLDVRLIKSARIMTKKGRRWKNNPSERIRSREGDAAGLMAARLRAGEADEPAARLLGALGYPPAAAVFDVTKPYPRLHGGFGPREVAELALAAGPEVMIRLALENAQFFVNRFWGPPPCPSCDGAMEYDPGGVGYGHLVDPSWVCEHAEGLVTLPAVPAEERAAPQRALDLIREVLGTIGQDVAGWDRGYADPPYRGGPLHRRVRDMIGFLSLSGGGEWATAFNFPAQGATVTMVRYALQTLLAGPSILSPNESRAQVLTYSLDEATVRLSQYATTGTRGMGNVKAWRRFVTNELAGWLSSVGRL